MIDPIAFSIIVGCFVGIAMFLTIVKMASLITADTEGKWRTEYLNALVVIIGILSIVLIHCIYYGLCGKQ